MKAKIFVVILLTLFVGVPLFGQNVSFNPDLFPGLKWRTLSNMASEGRGPKFWRQGKFAWYSIDDVEHLLKGFDVCFCCEFQHVAGGCNQDRDDHNEN